MMMSSAIPVFVKTATLHRHVAELLEELDRVKALKPLTFAGFVQKQALLINVRSDLSTHCRILRLYYSTHDLLVPDA